MKYYLTKIRDRYMTNMDKKALKDMNREETKDKKDLMLKLKLESHSKIYILALKEK